MTECSLDAESNQRESPDRRRFPDFLTRWRMELYHVDSHLKESTTGSFRHVLDLEDPWHASFDLQQQSPLQSQQWHCHMNSGSGGLTSSDSNLDFASDPLNTNLVHQLDASYFPPSANYLFQATLPSVEPSLNNSASSTIPPQLFSDQNLQDHAMGGNILGFNPLAFAPTPLVPYQQESVVGNALDGSFAPFNAGIMCPSGSQQLRIPICQFSLLGEVPIQGFDMGRVTCNTLMPTRDASSGAGLWSGYTCENWNHEDQVLQNVFTTLLPNSTTNEHLRFEQPEVINAFGQPPEPFGDFSMECVINNSLGIRKKTPQGALVIHGEAHPRPLFSRCKGREEWASMKPIIEELYFTKGRNLEDVMIHMYLIWGFKASPKMYKDRLGRWGLFKNNSKRPASKRRKISNKNRRQKRQKRMQIGQPSRLKQIQKLMQASNPIPTYMRSSDACYKMEKMLDAATVVVHGCFDSHGWSFNSTRYIYPPGLENSSALFVSMYLSLPAKPSREVGEQTRFRMSHQELCALVQNEWRGVYKLCEIAHRLHQISQQLGSRRFMTEFLGYLRRQSNVSSPWCRPILEFIDTLGDMEPSLVPETLRICHLKMINALGVILGPEHPVVLTSLCGHYNTWPMDNCPISVDETRIQLRQSDKNNGHLSDESLNLLDSLSYCASINSNQHQLCRELCADLIKRGEAIFWGETTHKYTGGAHRIELGRRRLSRLHKESGSWDLFAKEYEILSEFLQQGDKRCIEVGISNIDVAIVKLRSVGKPEYAVGLQRMQQGLLARLEERCEPREDRGLDREGSKLAEMFGEMGL